MTPYLFRLEQEVQLSSYLLLFSDCGLGHQEESEPRRPEGPTEGPERLW